MKVFMCKTYFCLCVLLKEFPGQLKQKGTLISYICQICIKSNLQNYNAGKKYLAIFLKYAPFQFLYFSPWKAKHANFCKFASEKIKETLWLAKTWIRHFVFVYSPRLKNMEVQASMELQTQFFLRPWFKSVSCYENVVSKHFQVSQCH